MAELAGRSVVLKVSGAAVVMTDEATTAIVTNRVYRITALAKRVIDWETAVVVKDGGVVTSEAYTVNYVAGTIEFATVEVRVITVSGKYRTMSTAAYANDFTSNVEVDTADANVYGQTNKRRIPLFKSASGTLTQIDVTDEVYLPSLRDGKPLVIEIVAAVGVEPERYLALLSNVSDAFPAAGIQERVVGWTSTDAFLTLGG